MANAANKSQGKINKYIFGGNNEWNPGDKKKRRRVLAPQWPLPITVINSETPIVLAEDAKQVARGVRHCIILLRNGRLLSCGDYKYGQLGRKVAILDHTVSEEKGKLLSWGWNEHGSCGNGDTKNVIEPTKISYSYSRPCKQVKYFTAAAGHNYLIIE